MVEYSVQSCRLIGRLLKLVCQSSSTALVLCTRAGGRRASSLCFHSCSLGFGYSICMCSELYRIRLPLRIRNLSEVSSFFSIWTHTDTSGSMSEIKLRAWAIFSETLYAFYNIWLSRQALWSYGVGYKRKKFPQLSIENYKNKIFVLSELNNESRTKSISRLKWTLLYQWTARVLSKLIFGSVGSNEGFFSVNMGISSSSFGWIFDSRHHDEFQRSIQSTSLGPDHAHCSRDSLTGIPRSFGRNPPSRWFHRSRDAREALGEAK